MSRSRARGGREQRQRVVTGARAEAHIEDRSDRQHRELDALEQA